MEDFISHGDCMVSGGGDSLHPHLPDLPLQWPERGIRVLNGTDEDLSETVKELSACFKKLKKKIIESASPPVSQIEEGEEGRPFCQGIIQVSLTF